MTRTPFKPPGNRAKKAAIGQRFFRIAEYTGTYRDQWA
jgi:hypothetical protein